MVTGRIYKLYSDVDAYFYIGSTINDLLSRCRQHRYETKTKTTNVHTHFRQIGVDHMKILLIEEVVTETREELRQVEDVHIQQNKANQYCLNSNRAILLTDDDKRASLEMSVNKRRDVKNEKNRAYMKERYKVNPEKCREYSRLMAAKYREQITDDVRERQKEYQAKYREIHKSDNRAYHKMYRDRVAIQELYKALPFSTL